MLKSNFFKYFFSIFVFFFVSILMVSAETIVSSDTTSCEFGDKFTINYDEAGTVNLKSTYFETINTPWYIYWIVNNNTNKINYTEKLEYQEKDLLGSCPEKVYLCLYEEYSVEGGLEIFFSDEHSRLNHLQLVYIFYSKAEMNEESNLEGLTNGKWSEPSGDVIEGLKAGYDACSNYDVPVISDITGGLCGIGVGVWEEIKGIWNKEDFYVKYKDCKELTYQGDLPTYNLACSKLGVYLGKFNKALKEYKECSDNDAVCLSKTITNVNEKENLIKNYCKSLLAEYDYDNDVEQECLEACLDIGVQTKKAKVAAGLISGDSGECGFSGRLLVWISNILRWIKYILPVIVIVMGIIDFIKAIAADKEDEMKKAQGAFVKRLIAAALVFIIPLIIEFILDKMGFGYNDCGIFDK